MRRHLGDQGANRRAQMAQEVVEVKWFIIPFVVILWLYACSGCAKDKHQEYFLGGEWQRCDYLYEAACGQSYRCGDKVFECSTNVQTRMQ